MPLVKVIIGSTRPGRFGTKPAEWLMQLTKEHAETTFELIDLKEINLPMLDEAQPALSGHYENSHTKAWSKIIGEADGFIFVTAEYNHTAPPALLNAIDFLAAEWNFKPTAFVSYGAGAGGARAVENLRTALTMVHAFNLNDHVSFVNYWTQLNQDGNLQPTPAQTALAHTLLTNIGYWAEALQDARAHVPKKA